MRTDVRRLRQLIHEVLVGFGNKSYGADGVAGNLFPTGIATGDAGVKGFHDNILDDEADDEEHATQDAKQAAICLIMTHDGMVLSVTRKTDPNMHGLPGGKVDPGETPKQAAARELSEEVGLTATDLHQVFSQKDGQGFITTTFACEVDDGDISTDEPGRIAWVHPSVLVNPATSPYVDYNKALFAKLGIATQ